MWLLTVIVTDWECWCCFSHTFCCHIGSDVMCVRVQNIIFYCKAHICMVLCGINLSGIQIGMLTEIYISMIIAIVDIYQDISNICRTQIFFL